VREAESNTGKKNTRVLIVRSANATFFRLLFKKRKKEKKQKKDKKKERTRKKGKRYLNQRAAAVPRVSETNRREKGKKKKKKKKSRKRIESSRVAKLLAQCGEHRIHVSHAADSINAQSTLPRLRTR